MSINNRKKDCRAQLALRRENRDTRLEHNHNERIIENLLQYLTQKNPKSIFVYISTDDEVPTHGLIDEFLKRGLRVCVPHVVDKQNMMAVDFPGWPNLQRGALGILAPEEKKATTQIVDTAIVPGIGFSPSGDRIGHGAGYYDRWLTKNLATRRVGIAYDWQILTQIPVTKFDMKMDALITENGKIHDSDRVGEVLNNETKNIE